MLTPRLAPLFHRGARTFLAVAACTISAAPAFAQAPPVVAADPSDHVIYGSGGVGAGWGDLLLWDLTIGDTGGTGDPSSINLGARALIRFSLAGIAPEQVEIVRLRIAILQTRKDQYPAPGVIDETPPFTNPGLGDVSVVHIPDFCLTRAGDGIDCRTLDDYSSPSLGDDPGVLIPNGQEPDSFVHIDVTGAVRQALLAGSPYVAFRMQTAIETDSDGNNDMWNIGAGDHPYAGLRPSLLFGRPPIPVTIDIRPGNPLNIVNLSSNGVLPVAILGSSTFDVARIDPTTISVAGASVRLIGAGRRELCRTALVNDDAIPDLLCDVETAQVLLQVGDSLATLEAKTWDGTPIVGQDTVRVRPD